MRTTFVLEATLLAHIMHGAFCHMGDASVSTMNQSAVSREKRWFFKKKTVCDIKNGNCSQICGGEGNKAICSCKEGYRLMNDKKSCQKLNHCNMEKFKDFDCDEKSGNAYKCFMGTCRRSDVQCDSWMDRWEFPSWMSWFCTLSWDHVEVGDVKVGVEKSCFRSSDCKEQAGNMCLRDVSEKLLLKAYC